MGNHHRDPRIGWALMLAAAAACAPAAEMPPNVILVVIDDLGWTDLGVYGSSFYDTPNLDRFAAEGTRFTQFYTASPVCSPTRASLMTGRHPARLHLTNWIGGEQQGQLLQAPYVRELPLAETTIGEALQSAGYTTGYIGKWHLGAAGYLPERQGFEYTVAVNHAGQPGSYFHPYRSANWPATDVPDLDDGAAGEYLTDRLTDEAIRFLELPHDGPFFLVLSHYAVHTPLEAKEELTARYAARAGRLPALAGDGVVDEQGRAFTKQRQDHPVYAAMVHSTDESIGRILARLGELGLDSSTAVLFVSDNGGLSTLLRRRNIPTANVPLRAGKGWLYEGGIRAPLMVRWPGRVPAARTVDSPAISTDLFPTILSLADIPLEPERHLDGADLTPVLFGDDALSARDLAWHFPHYHGSGNRPSAAIRRGDFKLVRWFEDDRVELYDLREDIGETTDLTGRRPELAAELRDRLTRWLESVGARMPSPNPDWTGPGS